MALFLLNDSLGVKIICNGLLSCSGVGQKRHTKTCPFDTAFLVKWTKRARELDHVEVSFLCLGLQGVNKLLGRVKVLQYPEFWLPNCHHGHAAEHFASIHFCVFITYRTHSSF